MISISSRWRLAAAASPLAIAAAFCGNAGGCAGHAAGDRRRPARPRSRRRSRPPPSDTQPPNPQTASSSEQHDRRHRVPRLAAQRDREEEELGNGRRIGDRRRHRQAARQQHRANRSPACPALRRSGTNGRANIISIRGFGPDFSTTTLNGRQQTTTNDSRAVEFDQYPSEILPGVDIYKTAEADHTAGGLVGSIDLRTIRPLDYGQRVIAVGVRGTYVDQKLLPESKDKGGRSVRHLRRPVRPRHARRRAFGGLHERAVPDARLERLGLSARSAPGRPTR